GFPAVISALSINLNNSIVMPPDLSAPDGFGEIRIADRDVKGSFDPEMVLASQHDFISDWKSGNKREIFTGAIGTTPGNIYEMHLPETYYQELADGDRDGIRTLDIGFGTDANDNELSLLFT
ncbi:hypothetical protein, partial [Pleionea sediminis]|uniref:hypothetical protein n=1 Tax=Pleionea sediminis TaxID=2569479 RepID=UPI00197BE88C